MFVSHDLTDAALLVDRVAVIGQVELQQVGTVPAVFRKPANVFVAAFVGVENILAGRLLTRHGKMWRVQAAGAVLYAADDDVAADDALLCIRAEEVGLRLVDGADSLGLRGTANRIAGRVSDARSLGALSRVTVDCGFALVACFTHREVHELGLSTGLEVVAEIEASSIHQLRHDAADSVAVRVELQGTVSVQAPYHCR